MKTKLSQRVGVEYYIEVHGVNDRLSTQALAVWKYNITTCVKNVYAPYFKQVSDSNLFSGVKLRKFFVPSGQLFHLPLVFVRGGLLLGGEFFQGPKGGQFFCKAHQGARISLVACKMGGRQSPPPDNK